LKNLNLKLFTEVLKPFNHFPASTRTS